MLKSKPLVSIIIVNYNGRPFLDDCLKSLHQINYNEIEIILVDNSSSDDSLDFVKREYPNIIIIKLEKNRGFAEPNNIGTKIAKGDYFLFLNNDTIVEPNFVSELIKTALKDSKIGILQSLLLKPGGEIDSSGDFIDETGIVFNSKKPISNDREIFSARGACMMVQRNLFEKLGGFDEKFYFSFEDVDLGWRARIFGYKIVVIANSKVRHRGGKTTNKKETKLAFHGLKNQLSMKITNFELKFALKSFLMFFFIYGLREIRVWFDYTINGSTKITATNYENKIAEKPSVVVILKSIMWLFQNSNYLWKKHRRINLNRKVSTQELKKLGLITNQIK